MNSIVAYHGQQEFSIDFRDDDIDRADHFVQMDSRGFGKQLVDIHFRSAVALAIALVPRKRVRHRQSSPARSTILERLRHHHDFGAALSVNVVVDAIRAVRFGNCYIHLLAGLFTGAN